MFMDTITDPGRMTAVERRVLGKLVSSRGLWLGSEPETSAAAIQLESGGYVRSESCDGDPQVRWYTPTPLGISAATESDRHDAGVGPVMVEPEVDAFNWAEGSFELSGVCWCRDFSCQGGMGQPCVNREEPEEY